MLSDREFAAVPFAVLGTGCVVAGGLVAAATAPSPSPGGSWAAAYLVLVAGVAQVGLGLGQALLAPRAPSRRQVATRLGAWNAGNGAVLAGVSTGVPPLTYLGGVLLVIGLALLAGGVRRGARWGRWPLYGFRLLVVVLLVSIPIGLLLTRLGPV